MGEELTFPLALKSAGCGRLETQEASLVGPSIEVGTRGFELEVSELRKALGSC